MTKRTRLIVNSVIGALAALVVAQIAGTIVTRDRTKLVEFVDRDSSFSVMLPADVKSESTTIDTKIGGISQTTHQARSKHIQFEVGYTDYPAEYISKTGHREVLHGAVAGAAANVNGKITKRRELKVGEHLAREITVKAQKNLRMRCRIILTGSRMYQLTALSTGRHIGDPKVRQVFDSFALRHKVEPAAPPEQKDTTASSS